MLPVVEALARVRAGVDRHQEGEVARAAVAAGATIINDVSCTLVEVAGELGVGYVAMHRQGDPPTMQVNPAYEDVRRRGR